MVAGRLRKTLDFGTVMGTTCPTGDDAPNVLFQSFGLQAVGTDLGQVKINNVTDAEEVARAVAEMEGIVDSAFAPYINNPTV